VTIYSAATRLYFANDIDRYAIGDRTPGIQFNDDDSLTITIQHDEPTDPKERANWLPAPAELFFDQTRGQAILRRLHDRSGSHTF
jgi:hypothetical protein